MADGNKIRGAKGGSDSQHVPVYGECRTGEPLRELEWASVPNPQGAGGKSGKVVTPDGVTQQSEYAETWTAPA